MEVVSDRMEGAWVPDAGSTAHRPELPPAPELHMRNKLRSDSAFVTVHFHYLLNPHSCSKLLGV